MSQRRRLILICATVGLVAGGAGLYFSTVYQPAHALAEARTEIATWEARYHGARDCLLGTSPSSARTSEALAIREMAPDPWNRGTCTPLVSKLSRGLANDTGIPRIEQAWTALDHAAKKAALAFATHVGSSTTLLDDPLPSALDALEAARSKLRASAELPAAELAGPTLPTAALLPIADGSERFTELLIDAIPSAHGIVLFGTTASRVAQVKLTIGSAPQAARVGPTSMRAVPDLGWGAIASEREIRTGAMDQEGAMPTATKLKTGQDSVVAAVVGTPADGILIYGSSTELAIARAKAGAITPERAVKILLARAATDVDGRAALVWSTSQSSRFGRVLQPGADEAAVELPVELPADTTSAQTTFSSGQQDSSTDTETALATPCLTSDRAWTQDRSSAIAFGGGKPVFRAKLVGAQLQGCTSDAALYRGVEDSKRITICTDRGCRAATIPAGAPVTAATTVVAGKLVALAAYHRVLGVWREDAQPMFYSLPEPAQPVLAHEWPAMALNNGKVIDVIARGATSFVVIRIPAS